MSGHGHQGGPPGQGYPPAPGGYPQAPQQGGYPQAPQQGGYPQQPGVQQGGYPQQPGVQQGGYPQQPGGYGAPPGGYPPQGGGPPQGGSYGQPPGGYPQQPGGFGGPPGGGFPPGGQAPKSGPPMALLIGGGVGALVLVLIIIVAVFSGAGSDEEDDDDTSSSNSNLPTKKDSGTNVMKGATLKRIPSTSVYVPIPPGWNVAKRSLYTFAISPDRKAILAFTTVSSRGEFVGRTQHASRTFKLSSCTKKPKKTSRIGRDKLVADIVDYECKRNGVPSWVSTVLVNAGRRAFPFVIYSVSKTASQRTIKQAQQTVLGMQRR